MEEINIAVLLSAEPENLIKTRIHLEENFDLAETSDVHSVIAQSSPGRFDCLILDIDRQCWKTDLDSLRYFSAPIICITHDESETRNRSILSLGVQDILIKSEINARMLNRVISTTAERFKLEKIAMEANKSSRENEARFNDIADRIEHGLWVREAGSNQCLYLNRAFEDIWGRSLTDMNHIGWHETVHPDDREEAHQVFLEHIANKDEYTNTYRIIRPNGSTRWIHNRAYPVFDDEGDLVRISGIARDITKERKIEQELRLAQKLESLGQLSAGIAHEINTPSQFVSDNLSFMAEAVGDIGEAVQTLWSFIEKVKAEQKHEEDIAALEKMKTDLDLDFLLEEMPESLSQASSGMKQIKEIVLAMKGFSHPGDEHVYADLNEVIANVAIVSKNEWKYVATLDTDLESSLPAVYCKPSAINQVVLNIIVNAAHAIADKHGESGDGRIEVKSHKDDDFVILTIKDNGPGMSEKVQQKVFDPFFTTKEVGKGSGQGLAIVHRVICEDHGGTVNIESSIGKGTCFTIALRINPEPQQENTTEVKAA